MSTTITITQAGRLLDNPGHEPAILVLRPSGGPTGAINGVREVDIELMPDFLDVRGVPSCDPRSSNSFASDVGEDDVQEDFGEDR